MSTTVLVISNNSVSSMGYSAALFGYGYHVETTRTFEAARMLLHSGMVPASIIVDVKYTPAEINHFINTARSELSYPGAIVVVGQAGDHGRIVGASQYLPRPVNAEGIIATLEMDVQ